MVQRVALNTQVFNAYINESNVPLSAIKKKVEKIENIMSGETEPTFNQLITIAKIIHVPVGALLLNEKLTKAEEHLDFRVHQSQIIDDKSEELKATIEEMRMKQAFLKEEIEYELPFIHQFAFQSNVLQVAKEIRQVLGIKKMYIKDAKPDAFNYFRKKINRIGVFVFLNGKVKDNTHRPLDIKEFRGFVLADKQAPIIFINQTDTKKGRLFTLIHELVHLFVGNEGIFNNEALKDEQQSLEAYINKITAELLVPQSLLEDTYLKSPVMKKQKAKTGSNFNNDLKFRMDYDFFHYVDNALKQNRISYTDAFQLVGVGYKGYKTLEANT